MTLIIEYIDGKIVEYEDFDSYTYGGTGATTLSIYLHDGRHVIIPMVNIRMFRQKTIEEYRTRA